MAADSQFPIPPKELIRLCHQVILSGAGRKNWSLLSEDFVFAGPVIGPLNKATYKKAVEFAFDNLEEAFPDIEPQHYDFRVDPFEPNRVWYTIRTVGTMTREFAGILKPTGARMEQPPQTNSMLFDEHGKCIELTAGYAMDRRAGNSEGLCAVFGFFKAMGITLPYPEGQPFTPSPAFKAFLEAGYFAEQVTSGLSGEPVTEENPFFRRTIKEINSKPPNKWAVQPKYKLYE